MHFQNALVDYDISLSSQPNSNISLQVIANFEICISRKYRQFFCNSLLSLGMIFTNLMAIIKHLALGHKRVLFFTSVDAGLAIYSSITFPLHCVCLPLGYLSLSVLRWWKTHHQGFISILYIKGHSWTDVSSYHLIFVAYHFTCINYHLQSPCSCWYLSSHCLDHHSICLHHRRNPRICFSPCIL